MDLMNTIKISAPISPYDSDDQYPSHLAIYGKGGHRTVATLEERDSISMERREQGMIVYVEENETVYALKGGIENKNWIEFNLVIGSGKDLAKLFVSKIEPEDPTAEFMWLNLNDGCVYYRDDANQYWIPIVSHNVDGGDF